MIPKHEVFARAQGTIPRFWKPLFAKPLLREYREALVARVQEVVRTLQEDPYEYIYIYIYIYTHIHIHIYIYIYIYTYIIYNGDWTAISPTMISGNKSTSISFFANTTLPGRPQLFSLETHLISFYITVGEVVLNTLYRSKSFTIAY